MFKIVWSEYADMNLKGFFLQRCSKRDFKGYPVPIFLIEQETIGL